MERFVKGDVVVLEFPFSNLVASKRRPVFVLKVPLGDDLIVCQITGQSYEPSVELSLKKEDFKQGKLRVESYLRIDKLFSVEKNLVKYKIGSLKQAKCDSIIEAVCSYLKE